MVQDGDSPVFVAGVEGGAVAADGEAAVRGVVAVEGKTDLLEIVEALRSVGGLFRTFAAPRAAAGRSGQR